MNVGTGREATVQEVADILSRQLGRLLTFEVDSARQRKSDRPHLRADPARLRALTGLARPRTLEEGLAELLARG